MESPRPGWGWCHAGSPGKQTPGSLWVSRRLSLAPLLPGPQPRSDAPVRATVLQTNSPDPRVLHPRISTRPTSHSCSKDQAPPPQQGGQMDAWMDRVTGFPHLQKADSQAPMPGVPLHQRLHGQRLWWGDQLLAKCPGRPLGRPRHCGSRLGWADQKQHSTGDRYTHISLTLSQVTQSRTERNKNKEVSESTAQAGAGPPGPGRRGEQTTLPSGRSPACVCACVSGGGREMTGRAAVLWGACCTWVAPGLALQRVPGLTQGLEVVWARQPKRSCRSSYRKGSLGLADGG